MEERDYRHALEQFFIQEEKRAFVAARLSLSNDEDALDAVQDAMMAMVRRYASRPEAEWRPLFYRILHNRIKDIKRKRGFRSWCRRMFGLDQGEGSGDETPPMERGVKDPGAADPEHELIMKDDLLRIRAALARLPERQRQVFIMRTWLDMTIKETAAAAGCSVGSVKSHYHRALTSLRKMLAVPDAK